MKVPKILDQEIRNHVEYYGISLDNFVRKSVHYLSQEKHPETKGENFVTWNIPVHKSVVESMVSLAKYYPDIPCLIRFAVTRQIIEERLELEHKNRRQELFEENILLRKELRKLKRIYKIPN